MDVSSFRLTDPEIRKHTGQANAVFCGCFACQDKTATRRSGSATRLFESSQRKWLDLKLNAKTSRQRRQARALQLGMTTCPDENSYNAMIISPRQEKSTEDN